MGTVEEIGIRSTRIRSADHTVTTVPNGMLSKMLIVNMSERQQMLIRTLINVPGDACRARVLYILAELRELLGGHPLLQRDTARARLTAFTGSSAEIEVVAYVMTRRNEEFLAVQEQVLLQAMQIVEQSRDPAVTALREPAGARVSPSPASAGA
jgi:MscS family membrane protein